MKKTRKCVAILLALVLLFTMPATVMAAGASDSVRGAAGVHGWLNGTLKQNTDTIVATSSITTPASSAYVCNTIELFRGSTLTHSSFGKSSYNATYHKLSYAPRYTTDNEPSIAYCCHEVRGTQYAYDEYTMVYIDLP